MQPTDKPALVALVTDVLAYYRQPVSEFTLSVWCQALQRYSLEQVRKALTAHATNPDGGHFAPKVADVVRLLEGTHAERALLAWGKVLEAIGAVGAYQDVVFDDPAIHAVIEDLGGWPKVCRGETKDLQFLQHRFCQAHVAYAARGDFQFPRRLLGDRSPDHEYERKGLPLPKPALVGDRERALAVFRGGADGGKTAVTFDAVLQPLLGAPEAA
jgi:hypothetical protein